MWGLFLPGEDWSNLWPQFGLHNRQSIHVRTVGSVLHRKLYMKRNVVVIVHSATNSGIRPFDLCLIESRVNEHFCVSYPTYPPMLMPHCEAPLDSHSDLSAVFIWTTALWGQCPVKWVTGWKLDLPHWEDWLITWDHFLHFLAPAQKAQAIHRLVRVPDIEPDGQPEKTCCTRCADEDDGQPWRPGEVAHCRLKRMN